MGNETNSSINSIKRCLDDYEILPLPNNKTELGRGSYGCVKLVREKKTNQLFAMKIMNKKMIFECCSVENLKQEIKI